MSFGDPNNPYGQQQGQPGYGYPQGQQPQQPPQPGYGYPQAPPVQQPYGGYPGAQMTMPGLMQTARVLLFIVAGLQIIVGLIAAIAIAAAQDVSDSVGAGEETGVIAGLGFFLVVILLGFAAWAIVLGVKFSKGGNGVRVTTIVYASLYILLSLANFAGGQASSAVGGVIGLAIGGIILASMVNSSASAWFNRPRY
ncbi:hypothetical protein OHA27_21100 [Streptomyces sp. NBC_01619]|uniref:hypothetical protein n=1 Tax=unclassified Streptomyces TaxID=2593676 RepID=UPI00225882E1|nr:MULTISPECIES: hypothetical protein [unclassified Streptomyces]MCX4512753.1 hypothetical protein [Streptomyces sp. NBC_01619]